VSASLLISVSSSATHMRPTGTTEMIEVLFEAETLGGPRNNVLNRGPNFLGERRMGGSLLIIPYILTHSPGGVTFDTAIVNYFSHLL